MVDWELTRLTSSYREVTVIFSFASYVGDRLVYSEAYEQRSVLMCSLNVLFIETPYSFNCELSAGSLWRSEQDSQ